MYCEYRDVNDYSQHERVHDDCKSCSRGRVWPPDKVDIVRAVRPRRSVLMMRGPGGPDTADPTAKAGSALVVHAALVDRGFRGRGGKARRGDIRTAALLLLAEEPRNGYAIMQEIEQPQQRGLGAEPRLGLPRANRSSRTRA